MNKAFTDIGWEDYLYWQTEDRKTLRKINTLLKDIERMVMRASESPNR